MKKLIFVMYEFFRSFKDNLVKNIFLMIIISIGFIMTIVMGSYYFDLCEGENGYATQKIKNGVWHKIEVYDRDDFNECYKSIDGCKNMLNYFDELSDYHNYPMFFAETQQTMFVNWDNIKYFFEKRNYKDFCSDNHPSYFRAYVNNIEMSLLELKSVHLDYKAYRLFGLNTIEGEGITRENTVLENITDEIPIVIGSKYKDIFEVGDRIEMILVDYIFPCKVVGILEEGAVCPVDGNTKVGLLELDTYIVFPFGINFKNKEGIVSDMNKYAFWDVLALTNGANVLVQENHNLRELVEDYRDISDKYNLPAVSVRGMSLGFNILSNETRERISIFFILSIIMVCLTLYTIITIMYDIIQCNSEVYGIYLMNGCSIYSIILSYIIEIAVIILPSILICDYLLHNNLLGYSVAKIEPIIVFVYMLAVFLITIIIIFVIRKIKKIDTEYMIR